MYKANAQKIYDIINGLVATTKLTQVFNYDTKQSDSYPYATVSVISWTNDFYDTTENEMISSYRVSIYYQNKNINDMEGYIRELADQILTEINKKEHITLSSTVVYMKPIRIDWGWIETDETKRICDITIEVKENIEV